MLTNFNAYLAAFFPRVVAMAAMSLIYTRVVVNAAALRQA